MRYDERKISLSIDSITEYFDATIETDELSSIGRDLRIRLVKLEGLIEKLLGGQHGL